MRYAVVTLVLASACVRSDLAPCGALLCPDGTVCVADTTCLPADDAMACVGLIDGDPCSTAAVPTGVCHAFACVTPGCGNGLVEPSEMCDDGNTSGGDGCSADCRSDETCGNGVLDFTEDCEDGGHLSGDTCSSTCGTETLRWDTIDRPGVPVLVNPALAYDAAHQRLVMFGGTRTHVAYEPAWIFNGSSWSVGPSGPPSRSRASLAYDPIRQRIVLFGGFINSVDLADTWELDATTWTHATPTTSPPARNNAGMVFDPVRGKIVMFGGFANGTELGDTWTYDGTTWEPLTLTTSPSARSHPGLAFDPTRQKVVLVGGVSQSVAAARTESWVLDDTTWTPLATTAPSTNSGRLAFHTGRGVFVLTGDGASWEGDGVTWTPRADTPAGGNGELAYDVGRDRIVWWNGAHCELTTAWTTVPGPPGPQSLQNASAAFDDARQRLILRVGPVTTPATWARSTDGAWTQLASSTQPQANFPFVYDPVGRRMIAFGATVSNVAQTWALAGDTWQLLTPAHSPPYRTKHALTYDIDHRRVVMFGGNGATYYNDTWVFDGVDWSELQSASKPDARFGMNLAYDARRKKIVMVGGSVDSNVFWETWELDGTVWTEVEPPPAPRLDATFIYEPLRGTLLLLSGYEPTGGGPTTIEEFDGTTWRYLIVNPPKAPNDAIAWDPYARALVTLGVEGTYDLDAFGLLHAASPETPESCSGIDDLDADNLRGCDDPDCYAYCDPRCAPNTSCAADRPRCGDGSCDPALENHDRCAGDCP